MPLPISIANAGVRRTESGCGAAAVGRALSSAPSSSRAQQAERRSVCMAVTMQLPCKSWFFLICARPVFDGFRGSGLFLGKRRQRLKRTRSATLRPGPACKKRGSGSAKESCKMTDPEIRLDFRSIRKPPGDGMGSMEGYGESRITPHRVPTP